MPPRSTPTVPPEAPTAPQIPSAVLRSFPSWKVVIRIDERRGRHHRGADALERPGEDEDAVRPGEPGEEGGGREQADAGHEDPPPAEQIRGAPAEQE